MGDGRVAEVFEWDAGRVLRLNRAPGEREHTERTANAQRAAIAAGVACPAVHDVIEVDGRWGIVMDRVAGPDQLDAIVRRPWTLRSRACELARLHADIVTTAAPPSLRHVMDDLPSALAVDSVPQELAERARQLAERLEDGTNLLHGDLHPGNVLVDRTGPRVIDWEGAAAGPPMADHAQTLVLLRYASPDPGVPAPVRVLIALVRRLYASFYQREFAQLTAADPATVSRWVYVLTIARLGEGIAEERNALLEAARAWHPES